MAAQGTPPAAQQALAFWRQRAAQLMAGDDFWSKSGWNSILQAFLGPHAAVDSAIDRAVLLDLLSTSAAAAMSAADGAAASSTAALAHLLGLSPFATLQQVREAYAEQAAGGRAAAPASGVNAASGAFTIGRAPDAKKKQESGRRKLVVRKPRAQPMQHEPTAAVSPTAAAATPGISTPAFVFGAPNTGGAAGFNTAAPAPRTLPPSVETPAPAPLFDDGSLDGRRKVRVKRPQRHSGPPRQGAAAAAEAAGPAAGSPPRQPTAAAAAQAALGSGRPASNTAPAVQRSRSPQSRSPRRAAEEEEEEGELCVICQDRPRTHGFLHGRS